MRHLRIVLPLVCVAVLASWSSAEKPKKDQSPEAFIKAWAESVNQNDPKRVIAFYDRSEKTELLVSNGKTFRGPKEIAHAYTADSQLIRYYDSEAKNIRTRTLGDTATASFEHELKFRVIKDGTRFRIHVRTTSVLHRVNGEWKIVLEHSSPIENVERIKQVFE